MAEWLRWGIGGIISVAVSHLVWITWTVIRLSHAMWGDGVNGAKRDIADLQEWRKNLHEGITPDAHEELTRRVTELEKQLAELRGEQKAKRGRNQ